MMVEKHRDLLFEEDDKGYTHTFELKVFDRYMEFSVTTGASLSSRRVGPVFIRGGLTRDGRMHFDGGSSAMSGWIHLRGVDDAIRLGSIISRLYELGEKHIIEWDPPRNKTDGTTHECTIVSVLRRWPNIRFMDVRDKLPDGYEITETDLRQAIWRLIDRRIVVLNIRGRLSLQEWSGSNGAADHQS